MNENILAFTERLSKKHGTKIRFVLVGIWNTLLGYGLFVGMDWLFSGLFGRRYLAYMLAIVISNILSILSAFVCHKYITFRSKAKGMEAFKELLRFFATYVFTFLLSLVALPVLVELVGLGPKISGAIVILSCTVISYLAHSRFSFRV